MPKLRIKNMVCPRCILVVQNILNDLDQEFTSVEMGMVKLERPLKRVEYNQLERKLNAVGFEIITSEADQCVAEIKQELTQLVQTGQLKKLSISVYLSEQLSKSYNYLSRIFSESEGKTIQEYWLNIKFIKAKEMLMDDKYSICDVSDALGYTTNSHFTVQFKKVTDMTPTEFRASLQKL